MASVRLGAAGWAASIDEWHDSSPSLPASYRRRRLNLGAMQGWTDRTLSTHRASASTSRTDIKQVKSVDIGRESPYPC